MVALQRRLEALTELQHAVAAGATDEVTLSQLQSTLEALLAMAQGQVRGLDKQLDRLSRAAAIVKKESVERQDRTPIGAGDADAGTEELEPQTTPKTEPTDDPVEIEPEDATAATTSASTTTTPTASNNAGADDPDPSPDEEEEHSTPNSVTKHEEDAPDLAAGDGDSAHRDGHGRADDVSEMQTEVSTLSEEKISKEENASSPTSPKVIGSTAAGTSKKEFVHNPRSEFVTSQELPIAALGLFDEKDNEGDDAVKKRLGVTAYPTVDLHDMLPGPIPDEDYTHAKPANQVQGTTYATFLEPYFRPFTEEDLGLLEAKTVGSEVVSFGRTISPYSIPPLGPHYTEVWAEEDHIAVPEASAQEAAREAKRFEPSGSSNEITDAALEQSGVGLGPFTARLMAALVPESAADDDDESNGSAPPEPPSGSLIPPPSIKVGRNALFNDFSGLEERLKREFRYVGILDMNILRKYERAKRRFKLSQPRNGDAGRDNGANGSNGSASAENGSSMVVDTDFDDLGPGELEIDWINSTEDDEISREHRYLQSQLKKVSANNLNYKRRLLPAVQEQMAWQEYSTILADLDKQVDQAYLRRLKAPKSKKKGEKDKISTPGSTTSAAMSPMPAPSDQKPAVRALLDKRQRWISKIGSVFKPAYQMMRSHEEPKFEGLEEEEDDDDDEE